MLDLKHAALWIAVDAETRQCGFFVKDMHSPFFKVTRADPGLKRDVGEKFSRLKRKKKHWYEVEKEREEKWEKVKDVSIDTVIVALAIPHALRKGGERVIKSIAGLKK